jgi:hypothetical protein
VWAFGLGELAQKKLFPPIHFKAQYSSPKRGDCAFESPKLEFHHGSILYDSAQVLKRAQINLGGLDHRFGTEPGGLQAGVESRAVHALKPSVIFLLDTAGEHGGNIERSSEAGVIG